MLALFSGLYSRDFKDIPSLKEVECTGETLKPEVKLISLQMHRLSDNAAVASLNVMMNSCMTLGDFSSCVIDPAHTHRSRLKVLVDDLLEGESRRYACTVISVQSFGNTNTDKWTISVHRKSK